MQKHNFDRSNTTLGVFGHDTLMEVADEKVNHLERFKANF